MWNECEQENNLKLRWIPVSEKLPIAYKSSEDWDGLRSDEIIFKTNKNEKYIGTFYSGALYGFIFDDFADQLSFVIPNVTEWRYLL